MFKMRSIDDRGRYQLEAAWKQSQHGGTGKAGLWIRLQLHPRLVGSVQELLCASVPSAFSLELCWEYHTSQQLLPGTHCKSD